MYNNEEYYQQASTGGIGIVAAAVAVWWLWRWGCSSFFSESPCTPVSEFDGEI